MPKHLIENDVVPTTSVQIKNTASSANAVELKSGVLTGPVSIVLPTTVGSTGERIGVVSVTGTEITLGYVPAGAGTTYTQPFTALSTVVVTHNLGKRPSITIYDSSGNEVEGSVTHNDANQLTLTFSTPFTGTVTCN